MIAIAMTAFSIPGPSAATNASARISRGKARKMSVTRISAASTSPPRVAGDGPDDEPDRRGEQRDQHDDDQRDPRAEDDAATGCRGPGRRCRASAPPTGAAAASCAGRRRTASTARAGWRRSRRRPARSRSAGRRRRAGCGRRSARRRYARPSAACRRERGRSLESHSRKPSLACAAGHRARVLGSSRR